MGRIGRSWSRRFRLVVLRLHDHIAAYQVKTSRDPEPFSIRTILLGAESLLGRMLESRRKLGTDHPNVLIETIYACDDYPRTDDSLVGAGGSVSSAAFIRAHEAHRLSWTLADWRASAFDPFLKDVQAASGLDDPSFEAAWRNTRFHVGGKGRALGPGNRSDFDYQRLMELAALLPRLVADRADRDRWSAAELLTHLGWQDPFRLRHGHTFPVDALYRSNAPTEDALQRALSRINSGYVSLIGPPGSGKSTLLAAGLLPTPRAIVVRYFAFLPDEGQGLGRAEAFDFLNDVIKQLKQHNLGTDIMPGTELAELRRQLEALLREGSQRFQEEQIRTLIVIDGLDHGAAPADQVESVVHHAVACLETDGHPFRRNNLLQEVLTAAKKRRVDHGVAAVARWRVELPARETSSNSDDPFAAVGTLEELDSALAGVGDNSAWGAARAFERLVPESDYEAVKALYQCTASLRNNERSVEAVATAALAAGRRQDAMCYLAQLKQLAEDRGDWSGMLQGDAKKSFHRLSVKIRGEPARRAAFDVFVDDLAHGRESVEFLLPARRTASESAPAQTTLQSWPRSRTCRHNP
jgi:energy-coupling factor transporter ATP-binding protein EcfA2